MITRTVEYECSKTSGLEFASADWRQMHRRSFTDFQVQHSVDQRHRVCCAQFFAVVVTCEAAQCRFTEASFRNPIAKEERVAL
jgi:hypothetical protein